MGRVKFFKGCLPQILLGPFLNTLSHRYTGKHWKNRNDSLKRIINFINIAVVTTKPLLCVQVKTLESIEQKGNNDLEQVIGFIMNFKALWIQCTWLKSNSCLVYKENITKQIEMRRTMTQKWVTSFINIARVNTEPFLNLKRDLADLEYNIPENRSFY